jgi:hypothetical protein
MVYYYVIEDIISIIGISDVCMKRILYVYAIRIRAMRLFDATLQIVGR